MAQPLARFCPRCGTETIANQKFCPKCGLDTSAEARSTQSSEQVADQSSRPPSGPTSNPPSSPVPKRPSTQVTPPSSEHASKPPSRPTLEPLNDASHPPSLEPPSHQAASLPNDAIASIPTHMLPQPQAQEPPRFSIPMPTQVQSALQSLPMLLRPPLDRKRVGRGLLLIVVLGGVVLGIVAVLHAVSTPSQPTISTIPLGTTVDYAGIDITVVNAQTSQSFADDPHSASDGMLRLQLHAQNKTALTMKLPYETIAHVTLPDGKTLSPTYVTSDKDLAAKATQTNFVDFAVPQSVHLDQVIFHLGSIDEAQLDIPLNGHANVDQYASKTVRPNQQISYYGLNWTLTNASLQFHIDGKQASKDMRYLILTLKVDNPLLEKVLPGSSYDYVRLKTDNASINLIDTTLPPSFEAGASGKGGTLTFLVPQDNTSFTLTLYNPQDGFDASDPLKFQL